MYGLYDSRGIHFSYPDPLFLCAYVCFHLLVHSNSVQAVIHDADPAVFTGQHKQRHECLGEGETYESLSCFQSVHKNRRMFVTNLSQVVKVVLPSNPAVPCSQTLGFIGDAAQIAPLTVEELPLKQLHMKQMCAQIKTL